MEIRMNDKIQIEGTVIADCGEYFHMRIAPNVTAYDLKKTWVTKIVERAESDAEQIERLKARNAQLKRLLDMFLCDGPVKQPVEHVDLFKQSYDVRVGVNVNDATPNTWESGKDVLTEAETEAMYTELDNYAQAVQGRTEARRALEDANVRIGELEAKAKERPTLKVGETYIVEPQDEPWYPPQQEGFGPWIEGPPVLEECDAVFRFLLPAQRAHKYYAVTGLESKNQSSCQHAVAYCIKL